MKRSLLRIGLLGILLSTAAPLAFAQGGAGTGGAAGAGTGSGTTGSVGTAGNAGSNGATGNTMGTTSTDATPGATGNMKGNRATSTTNTSANWNTENQYWRGQYNTRPYYDRNTSYSTIEPAYQYGVNTYSRYNGRPFSELDQAELRRGWEQARGNSNLTWEQAQAASRDAYDRLYNNNMSGTSPSANR